MTTRTHRLLVLRLAQLGALGCLAVLGMIDVSASMRAGTLLALVQVVAAVMAAVVWLPEHKQDSVALPKAAIVIGAGSLLLTPVVAFSRQEQSLWGLAESAALLGVLFVVARRAQPTWAIGAIVAVGAAVALMPLRGGESAIFVICGLVQALAGAMVIGLGIYLRTIENSRLRAFDAVRAEQRAEFARDLHDFIAHHVTGIVVQAQGAKFIAEQDPKRAMDALEQIEQAGAETMASMRRMVRVLRDPASSPDAPLAPVAGVPQLAALTEQFTAAGGAAARLHLDGAADGLPVEISTSAYRVVMEALTNVRQHATGATTADVWIRRTPEWLLVRVADNGPPAPPPRERTGSRDRPGYGLVGLTERVRAAGGRITAGPGIEGGWVVDAAFPLEVRR